MAMKRFRKRKLKARRRYRKRVLENPLIKRPGEPFSRKTIVKMKYNDVVSFGGVVPDYVFNMNNLFDPNYTGAGHQPYGRDTLASLYSKYRVFGFKYTITFACATGGPYRVGVFYTEDLTALNNQSLISEIPGSKTRVLTPGTGSVVISGKVSLPRAAGQTSEQYRASDKYSANANNGPGELMGFHVTAFEMNGAATDKVTFDARLEFLCEWFDPITLGMS